MIVEINDFNISEAAKMHSLSWQQSHKSFCSEAFIAKHNPKAQERYLKHEISIGKKAYMLIDGSAVGIVSVNKSTIENLYIHPCAQRKGYGTRLLKFAISKCNDIPTLWILDNNEPAYNLYYKFGFRKTGNAHDITDSLCEIELKQIVNV